MPSPVRGWLKERWGTWFAPIGQLEGSWLGGTVTMTNAHTELGARLLHLQLAMEEAVASHRRAFQAIRCPDSCLSSGAAWIGALSERGLLWLPEILGFTLAHAKLEGGMFNLDRKVCYRVVAESAEKAVSLVANPVRIAAGQALYHRLSHAWLAAWEARAGDRRRQLLWLLKEKACYGIGHHSRIRLAGRGLDDWLKELAQGHGEEFLDALLTPPERERFLAAMDFGGAMFGVFSRTEQELLRTWLYQEALRATGPVASTSTPPILHPPESNSMDTRHFPSTSPKRLYHQLLHLERFPACLPAAKCYVQKILKRARAKPPFPYSPTAFRRWIEETYACQNQPDAEVRLPSLPLNALRFGIEQLAPAILVDGGWLAKSLLLKRRYPEVGSRLWQIFCDEVGTGYPAQNHANVYRQLLDQAGISLPPFDSEAFIHHPRFLPFAFDLPAFLLAIGQFPEDFLPELLGLNLAIELSGLGHAYRHLVWEMEANGLDATIVRLHQSIDNLSSGHAALATDAILCYLETLSAGGERALQQQWQRIYTGYRAFAVAARRFGWMLALTVGFQLWLNKRPLTLLRNACTYLF
ncbi:MAG: iron-containing redox enzyme family protein [Methylohalobius sp.]|nr:iron-containing redox enzyme family protein [Methylohalobius sp.]